MLRRIVATELAPELSDAEQGAIANLMGHSLRTHREIYRLETDESAADESRALLVYQAANSKGLQRCVATPY